MYPKIISHLLPHQHSAIFFFINLLYLFWETKILKNIMHMGERLNCYCACCSG